MKYIIILTHKKHNYSCVHIRLKYLTSESRCFKIQTVFAHVVSLSPSRAGGTSDCTDVQSVLVNREELANHSHIIRTKKGLGQGTQREYYSTMSGILWGKN